MPADSQKKRKQEDESIAEQDSSIADNTINGQDSDSENDGDDEQLVNVDFDYFDPKEIDFHAFKNLLRQLFDVDNINFDLSFLADKIIEQANVGSTVKTDGPDSDPFAMLTILNIDEMKVRRLEPGTEAPILF